MFHKLFRAFFASFELLSSVNLDRLWS